MCCVLVRKFVIRREVQPKKEGAKPYTKVIAFQNITVEHVTDKRQRHQRSNVSSPHSASSTSATDRHSNAAERKPPRMLPYVPLQGEDIMQLLTLYTQNDYAKILQKRVTEEKKEKTEAKKRRASSLRK
jgi:small subunit ribosomal protein S6e